MSGQARPDNDDRPSAPIAAFDNSYARLPDRFYARLNPTPVKAPHLVAFNQKLAGELDLDTRALDAGSAAQIFSGNIVPAGAAPLAMAYAGHQFGTLVPQLGDGRAILLGEVIDARGRRRDIQLKGAGQTPFSRQGDGRAALGPVLREYLVSEAMTALGIPSTRALAAVTTGEPVLREAGAMPGAILTRVAASHIRVGTFYYFAARGDDEAVRLLADHVIARHYPAARQAARPYLALLDAVIDAQARLIARWMQVGFIHGVMNTDNMAVSGETIDFGPCAFMDAYDPATVYSAIDRGGRYAYQNQPAIAQWDLARLAESLLKLIDSDGEKAVTEATAAINGFAERFETHWLAGMRAKLGLMQPQDGDRAHVVALFAAMQASGADFTLTFRRLADAAADEAADAALIALFHDSDAIAAWLRSWRERLGLENGTPAERAAAMRAVSPAFIPRNHRVEQALNAAVRDGDLAPFNRLMAVLSRPYDDQPDDAAYADPPQPDEQVTQTFCGT